MDKQKLQKPKAELSEANHKVKLIKHVSYVYKNFWNFRIEPYDFQDICK